MKQSTVRLANERTVLTMVEYISREAAFKEFAEFVRDSNNSDFVDAPTWNDAVSLIGSLPAADVAPVVHGEWINAYPDIEPNPMFMYGVCSQCGFEQSISDKLNYCPHCGAKMDGGVSGAAD